jgi:uncharacterized membrane protein
MKHPIDDKYIFFKATLTLMAICLFIALLIYMQIAALTDIDKLLTK